MWLFPLVSLSLGLSTLLMLIQLAVRLANDGVFQGSSSYAFHWTIGWMLGTWSPSSCLMSTWSQSTVFAQDRSGCFVILSTFYMNHLLFVLAVHFDPFRYAWDAPKVKFLGVSWVFTFFFLSFNLSTLS